MLFRSVIEATPNGMVVGAVTVTEPKPEAIVTETAICVVFPANTVNDGGKLRVNPG